MIKNVFVISIILIIFSCNHSQRTNFDTSNSWDVQGDASWKFLNEKLIGEVVYGAGFLLTKKRYNDFILELEFKPDSTINSGVFIRCKNKDINPFNCYELNIWDLHPDQKNRTGALVARVTPLAIVETINKWNTCRIKARNKHIMVWINDTLTIDVKNDKLPEGFIGLQAKGTGEIEFRNITIKPVKK